MVGVVYVHTVSVLEYRFGCGFKYVIQTVKGLKKDPEVKIKGLCWM